MSEFSPEAIAVDWLHEHFAKHEELGHLRARRRGRVVTVESGPKGAVVPRARFRRDTVHLWLLEMPTHRGRWERTPYRDQLENLMRHVESEFAWTLAPIDCDAHADAKPGPERFT